MVPLKELTRHLDQDDEPLEKRLCLAKNIVSSSQIAIPNKEDIIVTWLCRLGKDLCLHEKSSQIHFWKTMQACLTSNSTHRFSLLDLRPSSKKAAIEVLCEHLKNEVTSESDILSLLDCVASVLESGSFQRFLRQEVPLFCAFLESIISSLQNGCLGDPVKVRVVTAIRTFYRETVLRSNLNSHFLKCAVFPLMNLIDNDENCPATLVTEIRKCFEQILFPKSSVEFVQFLDALFHIEKKVPDLKSPESVDKEKHPVPFSIMDALRESHKSLSSKAVLKLYKIIFESFLGCLKVYSTASIFQMFLCQCHLLGIKIVSTKCKISFKKMHDSLEQALPNPTVLSLKVLKDLVDVLWVRGIPLNSEIHGTSFLDWLQMLVENLFPHNIDVISRNQLFELCTSFIKLSPFTVETNVETILTVVLSKPVTSTEKSSSTELLLILFKMYHKMNRVHKVLGIFLLCLEKGLLNYTNTSDSDGSEWVLPQIYVELSALASTMPSESSISSFDTLLIHLKKAIRLSFPPSKLEGKCGEILLKVVCDLSCSMFNGVRLVENSVVPHPRAGFCKVMMGYKDCLHGMGKSLTEVSNPTLLKLFLSLSYYWAYEALLIKQYAMVGRSALLESVGSVDAAECEVSLSHVHPYLNDTEWKQIRENAKDYGDEEIEASFLQLDFQLLSAMQLSKTALPAGTSDLAKLCLAQLLQKSKLVNNQVIADQGSVCKVVLLSRLLPISELLDLSDLLVAQLLKQGSCIDATETAAILFERRPLASAIIFSTLSSLAHALKVLKRRKSDSSVNRFTASRAALSNLKSCAKFLVQAEINQSQDVDQFVKSCLLSMSQSLNELLANIIGTREDSKDSYCDLNLTSLKSHIALLQALPLPCLMVHSRFAIFSCLLTLAIDCSHLPPSSDRDEIISMLFDHTLAGLVERKLMLRKRQNLSQHLLDRYMSQVIVEKGSTRLVLETIISEAFEDENVLDYVTEKVSFLNKKFSKGKTKKEFTLLATILLQNAVNKKKLFEVNPNSTKDGGHWEKVGNAIDTLVHSLCQVIKEHDGKHKELIHLYALALDFLLKRKNMMKVEEALVSFLEDYCSLAVLQLQSFDVNQRLGAEVLLSTVFVHHKDLHEFIPKSLLRDVWCSLMHSKNPSSGPVNLLSHYISKDIVDEMLKKTVDVYCTTDSTSSDMMELWCSLLSCSSSNSLKAHADLWIYAVRRLFEECHALSGVPYTSLLDFLVKVISTTEIVIDMEMMDQCLLVLNRIELPVSVSEFVNVGEKYLSVLSAIFFHRQVFALDCVPNLFQKLLILIRKLGYLSRSRNDLSLANSTTLADLAYNVEKFVSSFTRPDFKVPLKRVAAYLIADVISVFEAVTLCSAVKVHFQNIVFILISMVDKHSVQFLLRAMSPASNEIFKSLYTTYTKYHAFKGKI